MTELTNEKKGYDSLILKIIAYAITIAGIVFTFNGHCSIEGLNYLSWIAYPIFAYLVAMGYDNTSNSIRYLIRMLLFACITEFAFNFYESEKLLYKQAQNGMFTLCAGLAVLIILGFIHKKLNNIIISAVCCYFLGFGAYWLTMHFNCEFYSFGVMIVIMFYISRHVKYSALLQLAFFAVLAFAIASNASITLIIGNYLYSFTYRIFGFISLPFIWLCNEKRGPNKLVIQILSYCFYPLLYAAAAVIKIIEIF